MPPAKKRKIATRRSARNKKEEPAEEEAAFETPAAPAEEPEQAAVASDTREVKEDVAGDKEEEADKVAEAETKDEPNEAADEPMAEATEEKPEKAEKAEPAEDKSKKAEPEKPTATAGPSASERMARFRALQARAKASTDQNLKAAAAETQRLASGDGSQLGPLRRKQAVAAHKLLQAEVEAEGGDFERKRAWDWTAEESARWDARMRKRAAHRDNNAFQDYRSEAHKVYKRQVRGAGLGTPDLEQYTRDKLAAVERAAAAGALEIVETADGELIAVDRDGTFYATAESTAFAENRPSREAVDRLVRDQRKADEAALRKRRERLAKNGEDADVTYINEKNKHFNQKLARFYNKYTAEIRESFERGTMI